MQNLIYFPTAALLKGYNLDVEHFTDGQLSELYKGLENNVDILAYANHKLNEDQMMQVRLGLMENVDISYYNSPYIKASEMMTIRTALRSGVVIDKQLANQSILHYKEMALCKIEGVSIFCADRLDWKIIRKKRLRRTNISFMEKAAL